MRKAKLSNDLNRLKEDVLRLSEQLNVEDIMNPKLKLDVSSTSLMLPGDTTNISNGMFDSLLSLNYSPNNSVAAMSSIQPHLLSSSGTTVEYSLLHNSGTVNHSNTVEASLLSDTTITHSTYSLRAEIVRCQRKNRKLQLSLDSITYKYRESLKEIEALKTKLKLGLSDNKDAEIVRLREEVGTLKVSLHRSEDIRHNQNDLIRLLQQQPANTRAPSPRQSSSGLKHNPSASVYKGPAQRGENFKDRDKQKNRDGTNKRPASAPFVSSVTTSKSPMARKAVKSKPRVSFHQANVRRKFIDELK